MSVTEIPTPPRPTGGVDWAWDNHAVAVVGPDGKVCERFTVEHTVAGLRALVRRLHAAGVDDVGIERGDGPVVEALRQAGLIAYVIAPQQLKNLRSRYGSAGNKDDRFDAFVLADTLRTDRARLRPLESDTAQTVTLRMTCRARRDLVAARVAMANRLRAHLQLVFPGAVGLFFEIDSPISLAFLTRFGHQQAADWLTPRRLQAWLRAARYSGRKPATVLHERLAAAPRGATGHDGLARSHVTTALVGALRGLRAQITALEAQIAEQLDLHPDAPIFTSLPKAGRVRAARLLSEVGDCRARFPTAQALHCLAGAAPSTRQSGKTKIVSFRWGADKQLRDAVCDSPATPATPTPGPRSSTTTPSPAARTTHTPPGSWPAPGSTSSGGAGRTTSPTTRPNTAPSKPCSQPRDRPPTRRPDPTRPFPVPAAQRRRAGGVNMERPQRSEDERR
ncbi:IS110 family transposase [Pseudonocardia sp. MH-G8]|uniref:IS110 family transposase n=1 Tax=Pseudonocardia sp. MH-G8 TaxID=1854588 RepID=UPI001E481817|nr:IS110 family transposase [Pseudonocardia sp. MH-G8]